jgi:hypothetical protein
MLLESLPQVVVVRTIMGLEPVVAHLRLVGVEGFRMDVVQLMIVIVAIEIDVYRVFSKLCRPDGSPVFNSE